MTTRQEVYDAFNRERDFQDKKWGSCRHLSIETWLQIIQEELFEAMIDAELLKREQRDGTVHPQHFDHMRNELVQTGASITAALEHLGVKDR